MSEIEDVLRPPKLDLDSDMNAEIEASRLGGGSMRTLKHCMLALSQCMSVVRQASVALRQGPVAFRRSLSAARRALARLSLRMASLKRAVSALSASERRLSLALEAANMGVWDYDLRTQRVLRSPAVDRFFGLESGRASPDISHLLARLHPDDAAALQKQLAAATAERGGLAGEHRVIRSDGSLRWLAIRGEVVAAEDGAPARIVGVVTEITQRKAKEAALRDALSDKETELQRKDMLVEQKTILLREVNHRIKNNLQLISSLLMLQSTTVPEEAQEYFFQACRRIETVARVHQRLYQGTDIHLIGFGQYLREFCADLAGMLSSEARPIKLLVDAADVALPTDRVIPLALIINELVTNALKHAFSDAEEGTIHIDSKVDPDGSLRITVADDGSGLSVGVSPKAGGTLGMRVVNALIKQLGASLRRVPTVRGTHIEIRLAVTHPQA